MNDIFGVIRMNTREDPKNNTIEYVNQIMDINSISQLKINWPIYFDTFYNYQMEFNDEVKKLIKTNILTLLTKCNIDNKEIDHLKRFINVNAIINNINELNESHNRSKNNKNYTLKRCQEYYLVNIINNDTLITHWFLGIFHRINLVDKKDKEYKEYKVPYYRGIEILKIYLEHQTEAYENYKKREKIISNFINMYIKWTINYLTNNFNQKKISLIEIFDKLKKINKINELFMDLIDCETYLNGCIVGFVHCWETYLETILNTNLMIDTHIITVYNSVNLINTNFNNITIEYCKKWQNINKLLIIPNNYGNSELFNNLQQICPLISIFRYGHNKSDIIIKYFTDIYTFEPNLIHYIMTGFTNLMNTIYDSFYYNISIDSSYSTICNITPNIKNCLILFSLYDEKILIALYFKNLCNRIKNQNNNLFNRTIIDFEIEVYNYLISLIDSSCNKSINFLNDIKNSIKHTEIIRKCKIKYVDIKGNDKKINPDLTKVEYSIINKHNFVETKGDDSKYGEKNKIIQLIDSDKYPTDINSYLAVGNTYYTTISKTKNFNWDVENSIINFNINNITICSTISQYILILQISNKHMNKNDLINSIYNTKLTNNHINDAKNYLTSIIDFMCIGKTKIFDISCDGLLCLSNKFFNNTKFPHLQGGKKIIKLSHFKPVIINTDNNTNIDVKIPPPTERENINKPSCEYINYLRLTLLIKMFKLNSTKIFLFDTIKQSLSNHIIYYININNFNDELITILKNLINISSQEFSKLLSSLIKRDIIEETPIGNINGYIYVV